MVRQVNLKKAFKSEGLLILGYYHCRHLCHAIIENARKAQSKAPLKNKKEILFLSVLESEGPMDSRRYLKRLTKKERSYWSFYTLAKGASASELKQALNFDLKTTKGNVVHSPGIYQINKGSVLSRINELPLTAAHFDFKAPPAN